MNRLELGWKVTHGLEPEYWLQNQANPGYQIEEDIVSVPAEGVGTHCVIIGQSGSGKSFFLGRFIEEILLKTKSKVVIIDPNSDFHLMHEVAGKKLWESANYNPIKRSGKLPTEKTRKEFSERWKKITKCVYTNSLSYGWDTHFKKIEVWWPSLSPEIIAEDEDPDLKSQLYHCHEFVKAVGHLIALKPKNIEKGVEISRGDIVFNDPIKESEKYWNSWERDEKNNDREEKFAKLIEAEFDIDKLIKNIQFLEDEVIMPLNLRKLDNSKKSEAEVKRRNHYLTLRNTRIIRRWRDKAISSIHYVSSKAGRYYFAKANEYKASGVLNNAPQTGYFKGERLSILDLPSLTNKNIRILTINALLEDLWIRVRNAWEDAMSDSVKKDNRVPTFIVLDEAHNFISSEPRTKAEAILREQFRTIAAEGRKLGLFLILASQRPDKLDTLVISECENKVLMKIDSESVLNKTSQILGLEYLNKKMLDKCVEFANGCVLISGKWTSGEPQLLYSAARRTIEGGRNLRPEYWAI